MKPDHTWALFLDRDGVINTELPGDYVKRREEFNFEPGALEAIRILSEIFGYIYIVTNQRGVGIGVMNESDLKEIHEMMLSDIVKAGGRIDAIYYCADADRSSPGRKPHPAMGLRAKSENPDIDFKRSVIAGNSLSDMEFGRSLGMNTVFIDDKKAMDGKGNELMDFIFPDLISFARHVRLR